VGPGNLSHLAGLLRRDAALRGFCSGRYSIGRGVVASALEDQTARLDGNLKRFAEEWVKRGEFKALVNSTTPEQFVDKLMANSRLTLPAAERAALVRQTGGRGRAGPDASGDCADDSAQRPGRKTVARPAPLFRLLHRNPDDAPDGNLDGFNFWLKEVESSGEIDRLPRAFMDSIEYRERARK
jgi:hypothetical protein